MKVNGYEVQFEVSGPAAMFTRPDTGAAPVSYPCPTYSAAKGMFECIARIKTAYIEPTKVEICSDVRYQKYATNYGGPLRKENQIKKGTSYQLFATVLADVCYRVYGIIKPTGSPIPIEVTTTNHLHLLQDKFVTRLRNGRFYEMPCLGWKEFTPSYFGPFRTETKINESFNDFIVSMLFSRFDKPVGGKPDAVFKKNVEIKSGTLNYVE